MNRKKERGEAAAGIKEGSERGNQNPPPKTARPAGAPPSQFPLLPSEQQPDPSKRVRHEIKLRGGETDSVLGYMVGASGAFFAYRNIEHPKSPFKLTHLPTGSFICKAPQLTVIEAVAKRLEEFEGVDWMAMRVDGSDESKRIGLKARDLVQRLIAEGLVEDEF